MEKSIYNLLATGIMRLSSLVSTHFSFLANKDKTLCPWIDDHVLNHISINKYKYPLPLNSSALEPLHGAIILSKLNLCNAYWLAWILEKVKWKTAFNTRFGHFEYLVMFFGLTNAPAVF